MKTHSLRVLPAVLSRKARTRVGLVLLTLVALVLGVLGAGPASASSAKTTICHRHGNGTFQEISVANSAVRAHLAHGDTVGPCRPPDRTRPTITVTTPESGAVYGVGQRVEADYACADEEGGSGIALCIGSVADGSPINTAAGGSRLRLFLVLAMDNAGNVNLVLRTYTLQADSTAPTVTLTNPVDGRSYDQGAEVLAEYTCADEAGGSGLASCAGSVASGAAIDTATLGEHEFTVTATDNAGNETVVTHTYTVESATTPVTITTPADGGVYLRGEEIIADYECTGMVTCQGFAPGRRPIEIGDGEPIPVELRRFQYAGTFTFWVVGTDDAGNETTVTHTYTVRSAPNVELSTPADGEVFVLGQEVQADYSCEGWLDGGPDIVTCDGTIAAGDLVDTSTLGDYSFTVTGVDADGNETAVTHAYSVVEDTTPPTATLFTPADGAIYALGEEVHVDWLCDDASGFVICDGTASYGDLVDTTTVGEHIFTMTATDRAGNETVVTHTYSVE